MNDWNSLEKQMRGWIPRRPSAGVKARLFSEPSSDRNRPWLGARNWLTPALACGLLLVVSAAARLHGPAASPAAGFPIQLVAAALSNHTSAACYLEPANIGFNAPRLALPKTSHLTSSLGGFQPLKTNSLIY